MTTSEPRSPLDRAAMRICELANGGRVQTGIEYHWDVLSPLARNLYRTTALEVFRDLAPEGVAPRDDGADTPAATR